MKQTSRSTTPRSRASMIRRLGVAAASAGLLFGLSACGFNAQTLQPYTPADGVNVDIGLDQNGNPTNETVKVRNLMILAKSATSGYLSATLSSGTGDQLTGVNGTVITAEDTDGPELTSDISTPVDIPAGSAIVLTDGTAITMTTTELEPGLTANLTLSFARAGDQRIQVPIIDGYNDIYKTVEPSPAPSSPAQP